MKFEITKKVKTPDGVEHDSIEAARHHMWGRNLDVLDGATRPDYEAAIAAQSTPEAEVPARILELRHALREVFLAAWPRASKGQPRKPKEAAGEAPKGSEGPAPAPSPIQAQDPPPPPVATDADEPAQTAPKRNHSKKAA